LIGKIVKINFSNRILFLWHPVSNLELCQPSNWHYQEEGNLWVWNYECDITCI